jgi:hypothetical protein
MSVGEGLVMGRIGDWLVAQVSGLPSIQNWMLVATAIVFVGWLAWLVRPHQGR